MSNKVKQAIESYRMLSVSDYQRIYPALKEAKEEYINECGGFDYVQLISVVLNKSYADCIDLPESEMLKHNYLLVNFLPDITINLDDLNLTLFGKKLNKDIFDVPVSLIQAQMLKNILLTIENPLKTVDIQATIEKITSGDKPTDNETATQFAFEMACFDGRIKNLHSIASLFVQPFLNKGKFDKDKRNDIAERLLSENVLTVYAIVSFFLRACNDLNMTFMEFFRQQISISY